MTAFLLNAVPAALSPAPPPAAVAADVRVMLVAFFRCELYVLINLA